MGVTCERAFLAAAGRSAATPICRSCAVWGRSVIVFRGMILTVRRPSHAHEGRGPKGTPADCAAIGARAGDKFRAAAGTTFFDSWT